MSCICIYLWLHTSTLSIWHSSLSSSWWCRYGCQVRDILRKETNEDSYLRPGNFWYRNVVHGKPMADGTKGKRFGHPIEKGFKAPERHQNMYRGKYTHWQSDTLLSWAQISMTIFPFHLHACRDVLLQIKKFNLFKAISCDSLPEITSLLRKQLSQ